MSVAEPVRDADDARWFADAQSGVHPAQKGPLPQRVPCEACGSTVLDSSAHLHPVYQFYVCDDCHSALIDGPEGGQR